MAWIANQRDQVIDEFHRKHRHGMCEDDCTYCALGPENPYD